MLNRIQSISYNDGTPAVTYAYDAQSGANFGKARLASVGTSVSSTSLTYDALGRVVTSQQATAGQAYNFSYGYNAAGALVSETYPSGRVLNVSYDLANRATGVSGTRNGVVTSYASLTNVAMCRSKLDHLSISGEIDGSSIHSHHCLGGVIKF